MGKTKTAVMDDSLPVEEPKKSNKKLGRQDDLVEKLRAELATEDEAGREVSEARPDALKQTQKEEIAMPPAAPRDNQPVKEKKPQNPGTRPASGGKEKPRSKKYKQSLLFSDEKSQDTSSLDRNKSYPISEAIEIVKKVSYTKFEGTLEAHINTAQTGIRGLVSLPFASGKKLTILAFGKDAETSGADKIGSDEILEEINKGKVDFDLLVTTPEWMPKLAKVAKILGPRGLMPNPKSGTITSDLKKTVESFMSGKTEYKTEPKAPVIHLGLGKLTQPTEELSANIKTLLQTLGKSRVKKVSLSPTMGPSVKLDLSSI